MAAVVSTKSRRGRLLAILTRNCLQPCEEQAGFCGSKSARVIIIEPAPPSFHFRLSGSRPNCSISPCRKPSFVEAAKIVFRRGIVGIGRDVEDLRGGAEEELTASEAGRKRADDSARGFLAAVGADEPEGALADRRVERRAVEQLRVVVAVTPG